MFSSRVSPVRVLSTVGPAVLVLALVVGCGDQNTERRGAGEGPDLSAGSSGTVDDEAGAGLVRWCDAYRIINCVCQQCHQHPPLHGAPIALMTYEDTQAPYPLPNSSQRVWQHMETAVSSGFMPLTGDKSVVPPVKPLNDSRRSLLLTWFAEGAHDEGGTACAMVCDWSQGPPSGGF